MLDAGYYRVVFEGNIPETNEKVVIKVMKPKSYDKNRDILRHLRESIFLTYMDKWEEQVLNQIGSQFKSNGKDRAFYYVPELGHCLYPSFMSVSPWYQTNLWKFIENNALNQTIQQLTEKAVMIAKGLELMHTLPGFFFVFTLFCLIW